MGLGYKLAIILTVFWILVSCSSTPSIQSIEQAETAELQSLPEPTKEKPPSEDSCLTNVRDGIQKFKLGDITEEDLLKRAELCENEEIYKKIHWSVYTKEYSILDDI